MKNVKRKISFIILPFTALVLSLSNVIFADGQKEVLADITNHNHSDMTEWSSTNSLPSSAGNYFLVNDVILSSAWQAPSGTTNLCLNGHYIKQTANASVMRANSSNITLNLFDCGEDVHYYYVDSSTKLGVVVENEEQAIAGNPEKYGSFTGGYLTGGKGTNHLNIAPCGGAMYMTGGAKITFENVNFVGNNATFGGCIHSSNSTLNIKGGTLVGNTGNGSAVNADGNGSASVYDAYITHNESGFREDLNDFIIGGKIEVFGNTNYDLQRCSSSKVFSIGDTLENTHPIAADHTGFNTPFTKGLSGKGDASNFISATDGYVVKLNDSGEAYLAPAPLAMIVIGDSVNEYSDLNSAVNDWVDGSTLKIYRDATGNITVTSGTKTLDLNNHSLTYTSGSVVIVSGGTLNICDNSASKTKHYYTPNQTGVATLSGSETNYYFEGGYITGGNATEQRGGGLRVYGTGSVVFSSGTIFANKAGWGGGIWSSGSGSVTIEGSASIIGNYSSGDYTSGGGIFMEGSCAVTMTGGSIRHNSSQWSGGGVRDCIEESTGVRFTMTGGEITGNYANNNQGNGFCFDMATTFNIGGSARIINNQGSNDIYIYNNRYLTITSMFTEGAKIGVTLQNGTGSFTSGWSTYMKEGDPKDYFVSNEGYDVFVINNEVIITNHIHTWAYVANGNVITATCEEDDCPVLTNPTLTIDAEGKTYDGSAVIATLTPSEDWTEENGLSIPDIVYLGNTNVGTYTASITLGDATASVTFTITPVTNIDVEVIGGNMTIDGIDEEIDAIIKENPTANNVSLAVKLEEKTEETATSGDEIADYAENKVLSFFDITLELTLDSDTTELKETETVLEIGISYAKVNKRDLVVYSYHDGSVRTFQESSSKQEGTFRVDKENAMVYIYTKTFSTYAIGYTPYYRVSVDLSFGVFDGKINVTLEDKNGNIVSKLENVDANNVVFNDVPMGQYKVIISWADEKVTTSLEFILQIGPDGVVITPISNS